MSKYFLKKGLDIMIHDTVLIKHMNKVTMKNHIAIDPGVIISTKCNIGNYVHVAPYCCFIGGKKSYIELNDFSFVAAGTKLVAGSEKYLGEGLIGPTINEKYREIVHGKIIFEKYSGCGVNSVILPNIKLGEGSVLGANSLLIEDTEPWTVYAGSPAKPVKKREKEKIISYSKDLLTRSLEYS